MKQGHATHSGMASTKTDPAPKAISPAWANEMGVQHGNHVMDGKTVSGGLSPMISGPGLRAPTAKHTIHYGGSQRKHD